MQTTANSGQFQAHPMTWDGARAAYSLVCLHDPCITLDAWLRFVRRRCRATSGRTGLIAIRDSRGIVHALFTYRVDHDLRIRRRLRIADLIVAHLPGSHIDDAIAASAGRVAASLGCLSISVEQPFRQIAAMTECPTAESRGCGPQPVSGRQH